MYFKNQRTITIYFCSQYSMEIGNLRMATKYSFHVKPYVKKTEQKSRSVGDKEIETNSIEQGQTIIIPTKGC